MPFVTTLTLRSGDRTALEAAVEEIRTLAERKGIELKGPHTEPPRSVEAPLYRDLSGGGPMGTWGYTVYERRFELVGREEIARQIAGMGFPSSVRIEVDVDRIRSTGSR
ncbi:MAG: 30S ribosomal protein S10 [Halobacteriales archaeon]